MKSTELVKPSDFHPQRDTDSIIGFQLNKYYDISCQDTSGFTHTSTCRFVWEEVLEEIHRCFTSKWNKPDQIKIETVSYQGNGYFRPTIKSTLVGVVTEL